METIAQQIKWDFETNGSLVIKDKNGKEIYREASYGYWTKQEYDSNGYCIYSGDSKRDWVKKEWDSEGNEIYLENSYGVIRDNRPKSCENKEIVINGEKFKLVKV